MPCGVERVEEDKVCLESDGGEQKGAGACGVGRVGGGEEGVESVDGVD